MKTIKTVSGMTYAVTTTVDCTVTTPEGVLIATCRAGEQTLFVAPAAAVLVSDEGAVVTASFNGASAGSASGGGVSAEKVAEMIASSEGSVNVLYDSVTQSPADGNLDNYDAYGWAMVVTEPGRLDTVTLQPRSEGTVQDPFPVYLNIWVEDGNAWRLLGASENGVEQALGEAFVWTFSGVELVAGQKLHVEAHRQKGSEARDARLSVRVVANSLADTGMIERNGEVRVVDWVPRYTLALSRPVGLVAHGVPLAEDADLTAHAQDAVRHITAAERASWNAKADTAALAKKADVTALEAHAGSRELHLDTFNDFCYMGLRSSTAGVFGGVDSSWLSARSDAVTFTANDDGFVYKIITSGAITELRLGDAELQALGYLLDRKASLEDVLQAPESIASHAGDSVRHVTAEERARWESAASGTLAANSTIADGGTGLASLNLHSDNAATLYVQRMEAGNTRNAVALTVNNRLSKLDVWGAAAGIEVSNKAAPGETPTARCRITATTSSPGLKLDDMPLVMTFGGTTLTLGAAELQALAALIANKDELLALLQQPTQ